MRAIWEGKKGKPRSSEDGFILFTALLVMAILLIIGFALVVVGLNEIQVAGRTTVNDKAYAAAEAGINRALLRIKDNIEGSTDDIMIAGEVDERYWVDRGETSPTGTPQWDQGIPTPVSFEAEKGAYSVEIWQSGRSGETSLGDHKVIRSTGTVDDLGISATRVIETRVVMPALDAEYDACLDYTIFNGNNLTGAGVTPTAWPDATNWAGGVTIDGKSLCPLTGRVPRGAVYTSGPIDMNVHLAGSYTIKGNVVSTDYIRMASTWVVGGMKYDGNVIAGVDPRNPSDPNTGDIDVDLSASVAGLVEVTGYIAGTGDIDVGMSATFGCNLELGGIISGSGGRVLVAGTGNFSNAAKLGRIHAAGANVGGATVDFRQVGSAARFTSINCGHESGGGSVGVGFISAAGGITGSNLGNIYTDGKFSATTGLGNVNVGSVKAGGDISVITGAGFFQASSIQSVTDIGLYAVGAYVNVAGIHGLNVDVGIGLAGSTLGTVKAANDVDCLYGLAGVNSSGVWAGRDVDLWYVLAGGKTGFIPGTDYGVRAGRDISINAIGLVAVGDWGCHFLGVPFCATGDIQYGESEWTTPLLVWIEDKIHSNPGSPGAPSAPAYAEAVPAEISAVSAAKLQQTPPIVDEELLLDMTGLSRPVKMIAPNWQWYKEQATAQDGEGDPIHLVTDGGYADQGSAGDGAIEIAWDDASYSSNEIIYAKYGENIIINSIDWSLLGADFAGSIVTKGSVYIGYESGFNWTFSSEQTLNVAAGEDIEVFDNGFVLTSNSDCNFHFWAGTNIDVSNSTWSFLGAKKFTGSFTAGNRVNYSDNTLWTNTTFRYSRWVVPAEAWLPTYKVLSWREV